MKEDHLNATIACINEIVIERLQHAGCITGHLTCEAPGTALLITLYGYKPSTEKPIYFWEWEKPFTKLAWAYMESFQPELAAFSIDIDMQQQVCRYQNTNVLQYKQHQQAAQKKEASDKKETESAYKEKLAAQTLQYGAALATAVVNQLLSGAQLGYSHRDYCGTGLQYSDGVFEYVELWDYGVEVIQSFASETAFTQWLSQQSDASLALLDAASPFYWGNQTITRKRLERFITGKGDEL